MDQSQEEASRLQEQIEAKKKSNGAVFTGCLIGGLALCLLAWMAGGDALVATMGFALMVTGIIGLGTVS